MAGKATEILDSDVPVASFVLFAGPVRVAAGALPEVAAAAKRVRDEDPFAVIVVFDRETAEVVDLDLRGDEQDVIAQHTRPETSAAKRGRPKLGVVSREVTLLPRHWDWLARQPGGASTTLRRLVEAARKADAGAAQARSEAAYRFMSAMAGDRPGFEEAARALFAGDRPRLTALLSQWPADVGDEVLSFLGRQPAESVSS
ncbi:MAG: hypothetical protein B7Y99_05500 [Caulobacterales bacterium 32-69-10]|nr:MAG: hypothetical protein B7Y99_05500 [Caulobacterales bacterium 32-69-10]